MPLYTAVWVFGWIASITEVGFTCRFALRHRDAGRAGWAVLVAALTALVMAGLAILVFAPSWIGFPLLLLFLSTPIDRLAAWADARAGWQGRGAGRPLESPNDRAFGNAWPSIVLARRTISVGRLLASFVLAALVATGAQVLVLVISADANGAGRWAHGAAVLACAAVLLLFGRLLAERLVAAEVAGYLLIVDIAWRARQELEARFLASFEVGPGLGGWAAYIAIETALLAILLSAILGGLRMLAGRGSGEWPEAPRERLAFADAQLALYEGRTDRYSRRWAVGVLRTKGSTYLRMGQPAEAAPIFQEVVARFGEARDADIQAEVALAMHGVMRAAEELGLPVEAIAAAERLLDRFGHAPEPAIRDLVSRAFCSEVAAWWQLGRHDRVIAICNEFIAGFADDGDDESIHRVAWARRARSRALAKRRRSRGRPKPSRQRRGNPKTRRATIARTAVREH